ncbi:hypothetical protein SLEP1_g34380 [Rubroshorea leprosula]|uniref:Uncharacterized protein n=1 Tax=Rubroshorea leprosula TaxID=152421 RepID=A0AAV5KJU3_9ROSI|nr:hypothetical protein SLEP1_g34380 [Rubroshorea leprosula]
MPFAPRSPALYASHHRQSYPLYTKPVPLSTPSLCPSPLCPTAGNHAPCTPRPTPCNSPAPLHQACNPTCYSHAPASPTKQNSNTRQNWHHQ